MLQFVDDPQLRNEARCCPVQLPLAVSGWVFKEELKEDPDYGGVKLEKCTENEKMDTECSGTAVKGERDRPRVDRQRDRKTKNRQKQNRQIERAG